MTSAAAGINHSCRRIKFNMADNYKKSALGFEEAVENNFLFLKTLGFRRTRLEPTIAKFESQKINVIIYFDRFEIDLAIQQINSPSEGYYLEEILRIVDPKKANNYKVWMASTPKAVNEGIRQLAELFAWCLHSEI